MIKPILILTKLGLIAAIIAGELSVARRAKESIYPTPLVSQAPLQSSDLIWAAGIASLGFALLLSAFALAWLLRSQFA